MEDMQHREKPRNTSQTAMNKCDL